MKKCNHLIIAPLILAGCFFSACQPQFQSEPQKWHLMLSHQSDGAVTKGTERDLIASIRNGCDIKVAWGAKVRTEPSRSNEHSAKPVWVSVKDDHEVTVQLGDFLINLEALGEPIEEHPRRVEFGGTSDVVMWRATLKTDGSFDAIWFKPHSGEFVKRVPQTHPMKWFADCKPNTSLPLYD